MTTTLPLPHNNTGLGFHYYPDEDHYRQADLEAWLPQLDELGASWLTVRGSLARAIPEAFIRGLRAADIEPIVHLPLPVAPFDMRVLDELLRQYARWGVHYVVVFDQPNSRDAWPVHEWNRPRLVDRWLHYGLPVLRRMHTHDLTPVLPPLAQGGDYWDTTFLEASLQALKEVQAHDLIDRLVLGVYGFTMGHEVDWGKGGPAAWPDGHPFITPKGAQDTHGFRAFEWYADVTRRELGAPLPMLMLAGGARLTDRHGGPATVTGGWHTTCNIEIATLMLAQQLSPYLINTNFWLLAGDDRNAWLPDVGEPVMVVTALKRLMRDQRANLLGVAKSVPAEALVNIGSANETAATSEARKQVDHYLLLPSFDWGGSLSYWDVVADYVQHFQPTVGFSLDDARKARHVTVVAPVEAVSAEQVQILQDCGCVVERVVGANTGETRSQLAALLKEDVRFKSELGADAPTVSVIERELQHENAHA